MKSVAIALLLYASTTWARVGESYQMCVRRYGKPERDSSASISPLVSGPGTRSVQFNYKGWRIRVGFIFGVARVAHYQKLYVQGQTNQITDKEFTAILKAYQEEPWKKNSTGFSLNPLTGLKAIFRELGEGQSWRSEQGLIAYKHPVGGIVRIVDQTAIEQYEAEKKRRSEQNEKPPPAF